MRKNEILDTSYGLPIETEINTFLSCKCVNVPLKKVTVIPTEFQLADGKIRTSRVLVFWDEPEPEPTKLQMTADDTGME